MRFSVSIVIEPDEDGYYAYCPALKGLHTCGATESEALENAKNAATAYIRSLIKHNEPIPVGVMVQKAAKKARAPRAWRHIQQVVVATA